MAQNVDEEVVGKAVMAEVSDSTASVVGRSSSVDSSVAAACPIPAGRSAAQRALDAACPVPVAAELAVPAVVRYGYCSRQQLMEGMAEYAVAMTQLANLRAQYEKEAVYNETDFRRQYSEYLNGQKDFPQAILLKRQKDLQTSMEKGIAFRMEADSLLSVAERELLAPIDRRVDAAIRMVATERGYECVVDTDRGAYLYLNPALSEDITAYVEEKLR